MSSDIEKITDQLARLERLRASGTLSEDEFNQLKAKTLAEGSFNEQARPATALNGRANIAEPDTSTSWWPRITPVMGIAALIGIFLGYPLISEGAGNECSAFEQGVLHKVAAEKGTSESEGLAVGFLGMLQRASNGAFAAAAAKHQFPSLPPFLGCTLGYYRLLLGGGIDGDNSTTADNGSSEAAVAKAPQNDSSAATTPAEPTPPADTNAAPATNEAAPVLPETQPAPSNELASNQPPPSTTIVKPSFDCSRAASTAEQLVCSDPNLASMDQQIASLYKSAKDAASDPTEITLDQRAWLADRNACQTKECLFRIYRSRSSDLARWVTP